MDILFRDLRILQTGAKAIRILYLLKAALTVGIIVFTASELFTAVRKKRLQKMYGIQRY
ncbi:MAG: hypothetical protein ACI4LI_04810 [Candidatus Fimenecus sp.]